MVLGASFDSEADNLAFADKFDLPYVLLCDIERDIGIKYTAARDKDAEFARRIAYLIGPDGTIKKAYRNVNPKEHPGQVLADLA